MLAIAMALGALVVAWFGFSQSVSWRGDELRVRPLVGRSVSERFRDLAGIEWRPVASVLRLTFSDGYVLNLSPYMNGARQLLEEIGHDLGDVEAADDA